MFLDAYLATRVPRVGAEITLPQEEEGSLIVPVTASPDSHEYSQQCVRVVALDISHHVPFTADAIGGRFQRVARAACRLALCSRRGACNGSRNDEVLGRHEPFSPVIRANVPPGPTVAHCGWADLLEPGSIRVCRAQLVLEACGPPYVDALTFGVPDNKPRGADWRWTAGRCSRGTNSWQAGRGQRGGDDLCVRCRTGLSESASSRLRRLHCREANETQEQQPTDEYGRPARILLSRALKKP